MPVPKMHGTSIKDHLPHNEGNNLLYIEGEFDLNGAHHSR